MKSDMEIEDSPSRCAPAVPPADSDVQFVAAVASLRLAAATAGVIGEDEDLSVLFGDVLDDAQSLVHLVDEQSADALIELAISDDLFLQTALPTDDHYNDLRAPLAALGSLWAPTFRRVMTHSATKTMPLTLL